MFATMTSDEVLEILQSMEDDAAMHTTDAYSPNTDRYPDNRIPFKDIHMNYLSSHKNVDPKNYLSNLRLMVAHR